MKAVHCMKASDPYGVHRRQPLDGCPICFLPPHLWVVGTRRVTASILQEASGVGHTSASRDAVPHTPPQVDISAYRGRRKNSTTSVGKRRWRAWTPVVISRPLLVFPAKKPVVGTSQVIRVDPRNADEILILRTYIQPLFIEYISYRTAISDVFKHSVCERVHCSHQPSFRSKDILTYRCLVNIYQETTVRKKENRHFFEVPARLIAEENPKKAGSRPKPEKVKKSKTEKSKTRKSSDKGSQEEKDLKTEGLVPIII